jgi:protein SCO1/2
MARLACAALLAAAACSRAPADEASVRARAAAPTPDVELTAHDGARVRFADLVRDRVVVIAFGYVRCTGSCPKTVASLREVQRLLGEHMDRDVEIATITLDPEHDTAEVLARHAAELGAGPGWRFFTATPQDVDALRTWLGLFDRRDPAAPRTSHSAVLMIGSGSLGRWLAVPALGPPRETANAALRLAARARGAVARR